MSSSNPFNNLNDLPDRRLTAILAVVLWLALAGALLRLAPNPINWIAAVGLSIHAGRTWRRFHRRGRP